MATLASRATSCTTIATADGQGLAVYTVGDPADATVVLVHGFPDDHTAWDGIVDRLAQDHYVVTYDTRGAGASSRPKSIASYRLDQHAADLQAVIDAVNPGKGVHLVGHDWGSVQAWHLVTGAHRAVLSFTSISGPCVDHVPGWIARRASAGRLPDIAAMWKSPLYMGFLSLPFLAPLLARWGMLDLTIRLCVKAFERPETVVPLPAGPSARKNADSIRIYAANVFPRMLHPERGGTDAPVQVLTPRHDIFIPPVTQGDPHPDVTTLEIREVSGGHWSPTFNPAAVSEPIRAWIARYSELTESPHARHIGDDPRSDREVTP